MSDVALCLPVADLERMLAGARRHGHRVVSTGTTAAELTPRIEDAPPEVVIAESSPAQLTADLVAACDRKGVRLVVVTGSHGTVAHGARLGVADVVGGPATWDLLGVPDPGLGGWVGDPPAASGSGSGGAPDVPGVAADIPEETRMRPVPRSGRAPGRAPSPAASPDSSGRESAASSGRESAAPSGRERTPGGRVIVVWGPSGAPGRTSTAIALAAEFTTGGARVLLADADTHAASVAPALGLLDEAPGFAAACRLAAAGDLSPGEFDRLAVPVRDVPGLRVLTGIPLASRWPELGADRVERVLAAARETADVVVVDVAASLERDEELVSDLAGPRRNAATLAALGAADVVLAVGAADPIGLVRLLRGRADLVQHVDPDRVRVVVGKVRGSAVGADAVGQVRSTLRRFGGVDDAVLVPWDPSAFDAALLTARPLPVAAPRSPARVALRRLAESLVALDAPGRPAGRGILRSA